MARKQGLTAEQLERIEQNRRAALARKKGIDPEQHARMEENRRKALERRKQRQTEAREPKPAPGTSAASAAADAGEDGSAVKKRTEERTAKQKLVAQVMCRWWYVLPPWPPENFDYDAALAKRRYRRVPTVAFDKAPEVDEGGHRKAYELEQFVGLFRNSDMELLDLRPIEGRPSYDQLMLRT